MSLSVWCRRWIFSQSISQHKSCSWISWVTLSLSWVWPWRRCAGWKNSACAAAAGGTFGFAESFLACKIHQDPASLTISDAMKAMFVAMVCTKLADLYGILGNISAVCHTFHWKQHSPEFQLCILPLQGLKSQRTSSSYCFLILDIWLYKNNQTHVLIYIYINISIYHIPSLLTGVWWCLMSRCRSFRFLSKQVS